MPVVSGLNEAKFFAADGGRRATGDCLSRRIMENLTITNGLLMASSLAQVLPLPAFDAGSTTGRAHSFVCGFSAGRYHQLVRYGTSIIAELRGILCLFSFA